MSMWCRLFGHRLRSYALADYTLKYLAGIPSTFTLTSKRKCSRCGLVKIETLAPAIPDLNCKVSPRWAAVDQSGGKNAHG